MENGLLYIGYGYIGVGVGVGLGLLGAALSISKLAAAALEGISRQPEAAGTLRTTMIIAAALIEGLAFFALVICLLVALDLGKAKHLNGASDAPVAASAH